MWFERIHGNQVCCIQLWFGLSVYHCYLHSHSLSFTLSFTDCEQFCMRWAFFYYTVPSHRYCNSSMVSYNGRALWQGLKLAIFTFVDTYTIWDFQCEKSSKVVLEALEVFWERNISRVRSEIPPISFDVSVDCPMKWDMKVCVKFNSNWSEVSNVGNT